jgi:hypothetical protein
MATAPAASKSIEPVNLQGTKTLECDVVVVILWSRMGTPLPEDYRKLMLTRAVELKSLTHKINGETYPWFDETLYLDADRVIVTNLVERRPDSGTSYHQTSARLTTAPLRSSRFPPAPPSSFPLPSRGSACSPR